MINDSAQPLARSVGPRPCHGFLRPDDPHAVRRGQRAQGRCHRRRPRHHRGNGCPSRDHHTDNEHLVIFTDGSFFDEDLNRLDPLQLIRRNLSFWRYPGRCRFHTHNWFSAPISRPHDRNRRTDPRLAGTDRRHGTRGGPMKMIATRTLLILADLCSRSTAWPLPRTPSKQHISDSAEGSSPIAQRGGG